MAVAMTSPDHRLRKRDVQSSASPSARRGWRRFWSPNLFSTTCTTGILPAFSGGSHVSEFTFRDRDRSREVDTEHVFNVNYEPEKDRVLRVEAKNRSERMTFKGQPIPPTAVAHDLASSSTRFRIRAPRDHKLLQDTFSKNLVSNIRLPYSPIPACMDFRAAHVNNFLTPCRQQGGAKRLDFSLPRSGVFLSSSALPNSSVEPWMDTARWQMQGRDPQEEKDRRQAEDFNFRRTM